MSRRHFAAALAASVWMSCSAPPAPPDAGVRITTVSGQNGAAGAFADGPPDVARYDFPEGLALDPSGRALFIADSVNHVLRRLDLDTNVVSTLAGTPRESGFGDTGDDGGVKLWLPRSLALTPDGTQLYFTDTNNSVIRKVELATGRVSTEFGVVRSPGADDGFGRNARFGKKGLLGPQSWSGSLTIDPASDGPLMYVADSANQTIRRVNLRTQEVTTLAGVVGVAGAQDGPARMATFNKPAGVIVRHGALYVTEANNLTVRRIDLTTNEVTTVAGKAPADPSHYCENVSPVIPPECGATDAPLGTDARFRFPFGVAPDGDDAFFVVDSHSNVIRRVEVGTTAVTTVAGVASEVLDDLERPSEDSTATTPGTFSHPAHVLLVPPRTLYVSDRSANCIRQVELAR